MSQLFRPVQRSAALTIGVAAVAPAAATLIALPLRGSGRVTSASLYMLAVVAAAAIGGIWSGLGASVLSFLGQNFFFTPPFRTFRVGKVEDWVALLVFLAVSSIVGLLLATALEERARATRRERETRLLNYFTSKLLRQESLDGVLNDFAQALLDPFALARCEIHVGAGELSFDAVAGEPSEDAGLSTVVPIVVGDQPVGTIVAFRRANLERMGGAEETLFEVCARQLAVAVERARLDAQMRQALLESETSQLRAALFSSVTHDLRTPLASIKASVTSLLDPAVEYGAEQRRELLSAVVEETDRLNRLVGNILDLARLRAGALVPAKEPTSIEDVIESVLHRIAPDLRHVRVRTVIRPDLPELPMDPVQIDQVLTNLLDNAARASPQGGEVTVAASLWHSAIQVRVVDQGPGIAPEERERVFEPFSRGGTDHGHGGSGLGLAIARAIVLGHGGTIWIEGAPSGGAAVVFELPLRDALPAPQEPTT